MSPTSTSFDPAYTTGLACSTCHRINGRYFTVTWCEGCGQAFCLDFHNANSFTDPPEPSCMHLHGVCGDEEPEPRVCLRCGWEEMDEERESYCQPDTYHQYEAQQ